MDNSSKLMIEERAKGSKGAMKRLRGEGFLPCSISRKGDTSISFSVKKDDFRKAFNLTGMSGVYTLQAGRKKPYMAMIREIQHVPGSYDFLHVTFQGISMTEETTADVHIHLKGRDELQHNNYELIQQMDSLRLKGLPGAFPPAVNIDVSKLEPGEHVTVADVELPEGLACLTEPDKMILSVAHPKVKGEEAAESDEAVASAEGNDAVETSAEKEE